MLLIWNECKIRPIILLNILIISFTATLFAIACAKKRDDVVTIEMRYFEFTVIGLEESFNFLAATDDPTLIKTLEVELSIPFAQRAQHINGLVAEGNGNYNNDFDWHYIPNQWELAEVSIELCDGYPQNPGEEPYNWCPWGSRLKQEVFLTN